ncbi:MAG: hypothetical protein ABW136_09240 [Steroidobacteraceae bacterium]
MSIARPWREVHAFASSPVNFPLWAEGLESGAVISVSPNADYGIADHTVELPDGTRIHVPLRVIANGEGAEVIFTFFQLPAMTAQDVERGAAAVATDLATLKRLLERPPQRESLRARDVAPPVEPAAPIEAAPVVEEAPPAEASPEQSEAIPPKESDEPTP